MYYHARKTRKRYTGFPRPTDCHFCNPTKHAEDVLEENAHAYVIHNRTFYDQWELRKVADHRMVIPKRHVLSLEELSGAERAGVMDLIAKYEAQGYDIFARSPKSNTRSVPHQHTHLLKTTGKTARGLIFLVRPHILWLLP